MLNPLQDLIAPALSERLTLVFNHVIAAEPAAVDRLRQHAGRTLALELQRWPAVLPRPPRMAWRITPAGLLEHLAGADAAANLDLQLTLDAANPAALLAGLLAGTPPPLQIDGDAQLAADISWLAQNLRWDAAADLERVFGPAVASTLQRVGAGLAAGLKAALGLAQRWRGGSTA